MAFSEWNIEAVPIEIVVHHIFPYLTAPARAKYGIRFSYLFNSFVIFCVGVRLYRRLSTRPFFKAFPH
jgi:hypothetical protein